MGGVLQKNVRSPNHHHFSKEYRNTPPVCIAVLLVPLRFEFEERETLSVLLPLVSQYVSHLYRNTPPVCIAILLGKSWWLWSPGCSQHCRTNWRCQQGTALQMGGVLRYKFRRCIASTFQTSCTGWGLLNSSQNSLRCSEVACHRQDRPASGQLHGTSGENKSIDHLL